MSDALFRRARGNRERMKTSRFPMFLALTLTLGSAVACAAPADAPSEDETSAPVAQPTLTSNVAPQDVPAPWAGPWGDGDTMGDGFGKKGAGHSSHCPTGKEKLDCIRHCGATHPVDPDGCISSCTGC